MAASQSQSRCAQAFRQLLAPISPGSDPLFSKSVDLSLGEMLQLEPEALWGCILAVETRPGDLVWWPSSCLHRVNTRESSWGAGGYL